MTRQGSHAVHWPWPGAVTAGHRDAARLLDRLAAERFQQGRRRGRMARTVGPVGARLLSRGDRAASRRLRGRPQATLAALEDRLREAWADLPAACQGLGGGRSPSGILLLERERSTLAFVFTDGPHPSLVAKRAQQEDGLAKETQALRRLLPAGVAPQPCGVVDGWYLQTFVDGRPLPVRAVTAPWPTERLADVTRRAALATAATDPPQDGTDDITAVLRDPPTRVIGEAVTRAWEAIAGLQTSVLRHGDLSPQNLLECAGGVSMVDWETAVPRGWPTFDLLHALVSYAEEALGGRAVGEDAVARGFSQQWRGGRRHEVDHALHAEVTALGLSPSLCGALEVCFFARRYGRRMGRVGDGLQPGLSRRMLEDRCTS